MVWRFVRRIVAAGLVVLGTIAGSAVLAADPQIAPADDALLDELFIEGETLFGTNCVTCHEAAGGDGQAPALSGHPSMGARDHIVRQILRGNLEKGMPAFAGQLSDRQVAAIATYIRNAWDNAFGLVREGDARRVRAESAE